MLLCAIRARIAAESGAKAFASRHRTSVRRVGVRGWLEPMRVEHVQDLVIGAMVQFSYQRFLAMLCSQILPVLLVAASQRLVYNCLDSHHSWFTVVEIP